MAMTEAERLEVFNFLMELIEHPNMDDLEKVASKFTMTQSIYAMGTLALLSNGTTKERVGKQLISKIVEVRNAGNGA